MQMRHDARLISGTVFGVLAFCAGLAAQPLLADTIVTFTTNLGAFDVRLFEAQAPTTVANFLSYVNAGSYTNTFFHRSTTYNPADIQIVQGGGFTLSGNSINQIPTADPIGLEAGLSNRRGTIAMARTAASDSATSQWFFNVQDNPGLNPSLGNDGYAVFGEVIGSGMDVIDAIAAVQAYDVTAQLGPTFAELPLLAPALSPNNLVLVESVVAVPEPTTLALAVAALVVFVRLRPKMYFRTLFQWSLMRSAFPSMHGQKWPAATSMTPFSGL